MKEEKNVAVTEKEDNSANSVTSEEPAKEQPSESEAERLKKAKEKLKSDPNYFYHALLEKYLDECMKLGSSDLHIKTDLQPCARLPKRACADSGRKSFLQTLCF